MRFVWDRAKAAANVRKHGIRFPEAVVAREDPPSLTMEDPDSEGEERYVSIGIDELRRVLVTVFNVRDDTVRIISSRKASRFERSLYEN